METPRLKTDINNNPPLTLPGNQQKSEPKLQTAEQHQETYENVKKSQLKISKSRARKLSSDHESDIDPNSPVNKPNPNANTNTNPQPKTQVAEPPKQKTGIPVEPKDPYRVGQVVDEKSTPVKTQPKAPVSDTEPQRNPVPARKLNLENVQTKEKPKVDESGLHSSRSEKDLKLNLSAVAQKNKNPQWPLDSGSRGTFEAYEKLMEAKGVPKNAAEIEAENKQLRQFLKDLNDQLQQHLEKVKVVEYEKKVEFKNKSPEEQIRTIIRELANNEKILAYNKEEYRKSEVRLNMIKDPKYVMSIQQEITKAQISIDAIKKENKRMELKNGSAGKDLDVIENVKGMPGSLEETHLREKEAAKFEHKLQLLKQKNESLNAERKQKLEKEKAVSEQIKKLERKYFGDSYVSEQDMQKYNKLHKNLDAAEEDLKMAKNKCKFKATQIARDMEELYMINQKEREHIDRLEDVLQEQAKALKELLSTEGSRMSKTGQDVLEQIKASLENEERRKMSSPSNAEESRLRDKERSATLLKTKSISGIKQLDAIHYDLQSPVAGGNSKHKNAIKRELEEKKSSWKETGPAGRPKLEELGNVKRNNNVPRNSEDFDGDTNAKKKPEQNEKKKVVKEQEEMIKDVEDEEKEKKKKKEKETKKEEFIQESPREMKIQASKDKTEDAVKEVPVKQQEVKKEQEAKKEQKEKKAATQGEEDANKLKEEIKNYSKQIEQEVTQKKGENTKRKEEQPANQQVIPKQNVNTEVPRKENKEENHDATQKQETKREEHGDNNVVPIKKSQLKVIKSHAHRLADDAESDVDIVDGNGAAHNKQEVKKKENTDLQLDLTKSKPKQNEESPLKSNAEGESKRKEVKEVDTKRPKQQESPQKSERGTHNEEVREWDDNNDFGVEQRKNMNKPKEVKKEVKKAADEFEEYEFDS